MNSKLLGKLLSVILTEEIIGNDNIAVTAITANSRECVPGGMFVAVPGPVNDGHKYIPDAIKAGVAVIICEHLPDDPSAEVTWVRVANSAVALGYLASEWYDNPSRKLTLIGVTGTNGKTTVATLLYRMARQLGQKAGLLSTVENRVDNTVYEAHNTTPSPLEINRLLHEMITCGCTFAAMEVSSHGMVQHRTAGLTFAGGVFTNLTRDHLDYHKTFDAYLAAKKEFFDSLGNHAFALTNIDDSHGTVMLQNTRASRHTYSLRAAADFKGHIVESRIDGMLLRFNDIEFETPFAGRFNAYNLLAVFGTWVLLGTEPQQAILALSTLVPVAGRFQTFRSSDGVTAVVDYAHTPDALANVLQTIGDVVGDRKKIITVTGAGGNRDHGKRPLMGAEAARRSGRIIITSDNPRDEDPEMIADDIKAGIPVDSDVITDIILERAAAIHVAITEAAPGQVVLVAGKGHEDYQEFENKRRIHFDDREQVKSALESRNTLNKQN